MKRTEYTKDFKILLLEGFSRQCLPLMKAIHKLGCHLTTYNSSKLDVGYASRYPDKRLILPWDRTNEEKSYMFLLQLIRNEHFNLVIPLTDFSAIICSKHKKELEKYAKIAVNDWEIFEMASDKLNTMKVCMSNSIPCPKTIVDYDIDNLEKINVTFPVVVKPRTGYGSIGFSIAKSYDEIREKVAQNEKRFGSMLIQEYIPQTDLQYKCEIMMDSNHNVKSAVVFSKVRWYPIDGGSSTLNITVDRPDIVETCSRLLKKIGWIGYGDIDLIQDPRDGIAKVMEINPRITGSVKICFYAGVDFAKQIIELALGKKVTPYMNYDIGKRLRYFHTDLLWFVKSKNRFSCKPSWFSNYKTVDQIFSWTDMLPFLTYSIQAIKRYKKESKNKEH